MKENRRPTKAITVDEMMLYADKHSLIDESKIDFDTWSYYYEEASWYGFSFDTSEDRSVHYVVVQFLHFFIANYKSN